MTFLRQLFSRRFEKARALRDALACSVRVVYPRLPAHGFRPVILEDGLVWTIDDLGDLRVDGVNPGAVGRKERFKVLWARLVRPFLRGAEAARGAIYVYRRIKRDRANQLALERGAENTGFHAAETIDPFAKYKAAKT